MSLDRVILMLMLLLPPMSSPEPLDLGSNKSGSRARFGVNTIPKKNKVSKRLLLLFSGTVSVLYISP